MNAVVSEKAPPCCCSGCVLCCREPICTSHIGVEPLDVRLKIRLQSDDNCLDEEWLLQPYYIDEWGCTVAWYPDYPGIPGDSCLENIDIRLLCASETENNCAAYHWELWGMGLGIDCHLELDDPFPVSCSCRPFELVFRGTIVDPYATCDCGCTNGVGVTITISCP